MAQQSASNTPYVKIEIKNKITGIMRISWERLYQGSEAEYYHGLAVAGDGSLVRARITLPADGRKLYRQRVANPCAQSDFGTWTYTNQTNCLAVAAASFGAEVSIFWINSNRELRRIKSTDNGASWSVPELLDYSPSTEVHGLAAVYKSGGNLAVFFINQASLYIKKCVNGNWQAKSVWDKNTGELSGVAAIYNNDWNLLVTGKDSNGNFKVWSLVYGDGASIPAGTWSSLKEIASAPADGDLEHGAIFADKSDVYRAFYVEKFSGIQSYNRPFWIYSVQDAVFIDNLWGEPVPFNLACEYGIAIAHSGNCAWLSTPAGVWRGNMKEAILDITADVIAAQYETLPRAGHLVIDLKNDDGRYQSPGEGNLATMKIGNQLEFSPGYVTQQQNEVSPGAVFWLEGWEHTSSEGKSSLTLYGVDGWRLLENWRAGHQFRWNKDSNEMNVKQILQFVLARVGLKLEVKSESSTVNGFYPDFTIHPDDRGDSIIARLLSFVPDMVFIDGVKASLVNPQSSDSVLYSYGTSHIILQGKYKLSTWQNQRVRVEGYDTGVGVPLIVDTFSWEQLEYFYDKVATITDRNINTIAAGQARGSAFLRKTQIDSVCGAINIPVNCGQQLSDVIDITDDRAGLSNSKRRVVGILLNYRPDRGEYTQNLLLGGV